MSSPAERNVDSSRISRGRLTWFALVYLFFAVYGSLVPLDFQNRSLAEAWIAFRDINSMSLSFSSRTDWLVNIVLFIPLAFLLTGALWPAGGVIVCALVILAVFVVCLAFSVTIEFAQLFFPQRTPSLNDIVAQTAGTGLGISAWIAFGSRLSGWFIGWRNAHAPLDVWKRLLYSYLFVLLVYNLLPLDLTVSPVEIFHKLREGRLVLLPFSFIFSNPIEAIYDYGVDILTWIPAAFLWCLAFPRGQLRSWLELVGVASAFEFLQLFVYSRVTDVTDIFTAAIGAAIGTWLAKRLGPTASGEAAEPLPHLSGAWFFLALIWMVMLAAVFFYPFDFQMGREFLAERIQGAHKVPFEVYYYDTEYRAATEVLHKAGFFLPLGALLALAVMSIQNYRWKRYARAAALTLIGITAFGIEVGQLFIPGKNVDVTDWMLEVLGGIAGFAIIQYLNRMLFRAAPNTASLSAPMPAVGEIGMMGTMGTTGTMRAEMRGRRALAVTAIGIVIWVGIAWLIMRSSLTPYNVRELVDSRHPLLSLVLLAGWFYWITGFPVLIVQWLTRGEMYLLSLPHLALIHGLVAWILLRFAVPMESIHDIVGSPILNWPWEWEMLGRFLALFSFWTVSATAGGIIAVWHTLPGVKSALLGWAVGALLLIPISYYVVVVSAATDNLVELIARNGSAGAFLLLGVAITGILFGGTKVALALIPGAEWRARAAAWALGSCAISYLALYSGTEQIIVKYNQVFSALQFLLSSDRSHLAGPSELVVRYIAVWSFLVAAIAMVQYPIWRWVISDRREPMAV